MAKFFFAGQNANGKADARRRERNAAEARERYSEYIKERGELDGTSTGMAPGDPVSFRGDGAILHHEERDQHTGNIDQVVQRSSGTGSGTYRVRWQKTGDGTMRIVETKRIFD